MCQRNRNRRSLYVLLEADVARHWSPASSASARLSALPSPVWSAFLGHPALFERQVLGVVAGFAGVFSPQDDASAQTGANIAQKTTTPPIDAHHGPQCRVRSDSASADGLLHHHFRRMLEVDVPASDIKHGHRRWNRDP